MRLMHRPPALLVLCLSILASCVFAQAQPAGEKEYRPRPGQEGKDVMWLPTADTLVNKMLDMAKVTPKDFVMDLGSGDGRTVIAAAKRGARALGIEYNPDMVEVSRRAAAKEGVTDKAQFVKADIFETDYSKATVITMFLLPDLNVKLRPRLLNLKPGTRLVSNTFKMGEWKADQTFNVKDKCTSYCTALLWIVPARAGGKWRLKQGELRLKQDYQFLSGTLTTAEGIQILVSGRLYGDQVSLAMGEAHYSGRVNGDTMEGSGWSASRVSNN